MGRDCAEEKEEEEEAAAEVFSFFLDPPPLVTAAPCTACCLLVTEGAPLIEGEEVMAAAPLPQEFFFLAFLPLAVDFIMALRGMRTSSLKHSISPMRAPARRLIWAFAARGRPEEDSRMPSRLGKVSFLFVVIARRCCELVVAPAFGLFASLVGARGGSTSLDWLTAASHLLILPGPTRGL